jgi:endoglycosylceramidase
MRCLWLSLLLATACHGSTASPAIDAAAMSCGATGSPHVCGGFLRDADGRAMILRGANLSGMNKSAPYFDQDVAADYVKLRTDWGMNAIRFLVLWAAIEPQQGMFDDTYLDAVATRVGWARDAGLQVILDMHQDVYGEGFGFDGAPKWTCDAAEYAAFMPQASWFLDYTDPHVMNCIRHFYTTPAIEAEYVESWRRLAMKVADDPAVIGFDPMNEPFFGDFPETSFETDELLPLYVQVTTAVRSAAPQWIAFLEPGASRNLGFPTGFTHFPMANVAYAPHSYDQAAEQGMGFDQTKRDAFIGNIALLEGEAQSLGAALWIGEYGGTTTSPNITGYMDAAYDGAGAVAASTMYWDYSRSSNGYGMMNDDSSEKQVLLDVLVRPYPALVAGDPISYAWDETTSTFTFTYHPDREITAPTEIVVPAARFPSGFTVDCGGCTTEMIDGGVRLTSAPPGDPAVVTIH